MAVLLGDYVFATSARFVCDTNSIRLIRRFAETIAELSRGELDEILYAWDPGLTREAYLARIYDKTASLFCTAAESGAVLGEGDDEGIGRLREYGYNIGMAYQVLDDLLDYESTATELGKPAGHDLGEGVLTLPAILAAREPEAARAISDYFSAPANDREPFYARAIETIRASGALQETRSVAEGYIDNAIRSLDGLPASHERESLIHLSEFIRKRRN